MKSSSAENAPLGFVLEVHIALTTSKTGHLRKCAVGEVNGMKKEKKTERKTK
jgi:hypothetical protein